MTIVTIRSFRNGSEPSHMDNYLIHVCNHQMSLLYGTTIAFEYQTIYDLIRALIFACVIITVVSVPFRLKSTRPNPWFEYESQIAIMHKYLMAEDLLCRILCTR